MRRRSTDVKLGELLVERGLIDEARLAAALEECTRRAVGLAVVLVEGEVLGESALLEAVAAGWRVPTLDLRTFSPDPDVVARVPMEIAKRLQVLAVGREGWTLRVATADPLDVLALDDLKIATRHEIQPVFVYEGALAQALDALDAPEEVSELMESMEDLDEDSAMLLDEEDHAAGGGPSQPAASASLDDTGMFEPPPIPMPARRASSSPRSKPADEAGPLPEGARAVVDVFYATDRGRRLLRRKPDSLFSGSRNRAGTLQFGHCHVSIPTGHRTGRLERPSVFRLEFRERVAKHVVIADLDEYSAREFHENLRLRIAASQGRDALVFVHGFNVSFGDAVRRTAQLAYDLEFEGAPITYSWPSRGKLSGYLTDENNVAWSVPHLEAFLLELRERTGAETVHLIAHSMGSRALTEALARIAARPRTAERAEFRQVVLAAPDIDADVFRDLAPRFAATAGRVTLYASSKDEALKVSGTLHGGYPRAGQTEPEVVVVQGVDTIDASAVRTGLGHSYYGDEPTIVSDLYYLLRKDTPPGERHRMEPRRRDDIIYWELRG